MNYIDFTPQSFCLLTYLGYGLLLLFPVNKHRITLSIEKGGRWYVQSLNILSGNPPPRNLKKPRLWQAWRQKWKEWEDKFNTFWLGQYKSENQNLHPGFFKRIHWSVAAQEVGRSLAVCEAELQHFSVSYDCSSLRKLHLQVLLEMMGKRDSLEPSA